MYRHPLSNLPNTKWIFNSTDLCTKMDLTHCQGASELFQAQSHIYKHIFNYIDSMSLKCAVQLGIPDIIHKHNQPITLPELVSALQFPPTKTSCVHRLMRLLVHSGFFATRKVHEEEEEEEEEEGYVLTPPSRLLLKDNITSFSPAVLGFLDPVLVTPWHFLGEWFRGSELTAFETAHGMDFWDYGNQNPEFGQFLIELMASESRIISSRVQDYSAILEGVASLVDVGGGTGTVARAISEAFPRLKCTVLDLPHVVSNLPKSKNLDYVGGDMFQSIPSADAVLLKSILHNWSDEDCVEILKRCREAIRSNNEGGKVIIVEMVINDKKDQHELTKTKLFYDMMRMVLRAGRERNDKEWEKLFLEAGFRRYKITPTFGLSSVIEVYP